MIFASDWLNLPRRSLRKLYIRAFEPESAYIRVLEHHEWESTKVKSKRGDTFLAPISFSDIFPNLVELHICDTNISSMMSTGWELLEGMVANLPPQLHTFSLGYVQWTSKLLAALPLSLTKLGCCGTMVNDSFAALKDHSQLVSLTWEADRNISHAFSEIIASIPSQITRFKFIGAWKQSAEVHLPRSLTKLRFCASRVQKRLVRKFNASDLAQLPSSLTDIRWDGWTLDSQNDQQGDTTAHYSVLPLGIRSLSWPLPPPKQASLALYPHLHTLIVNNTENIRIERYSFTDFPKALHTFHLAPSYTLSPESLALFPETLTSLHFSALLVLEYSFKKIPRTVIDLALASISHFSDETLSDLPPHLTSLELRPNTDISSKEIRLSDSGLKRLPPTLRDFYSTLLLELTGIGCDSHCERWDSTVALDLCRLQLPLGVREKFSFPPSMVVSLVHVPSTLKHLEVLHGKMEPVALKRFKMLETLELGKDTQLPDLAILNGLVHLKSYTNNRDSTIDDFLKTLPDHLEKVAFPHSTASPAYLSRPKLPASLTHLSIGIFSGYLLGALGPKLTTFEVLQERYYDSDVNLKRLPPTLQSFHFVTQHKFQAGLRLEEYKLFDKTLRVMPMQSLTSLALPLDRRVTAELLSSFPSLRALNIGVLVFTTPPKFPFGTTDVVIPQSAVSELISRLGVTPQNFTCRRVFSTFDLNKLVLPPSVTAFTYRTHMEKILLDSQFVSKLPRSLLKLDLGPARFELRSCIAALPRQLTTCAIIIPMFPESALDDLPSTITNLTVTKGIHSNSLLLPPKLTRLYLIPDPAQRQRIDDKFIETLPRSLLDLTLHGTSVTDAGLLHLPPNLTRLELHAKDITIAGTAHLPTTLVSLDFGYHSDLLIHKHDILERLHLARLASTVVVAVPQTSQNTADM
jgi:hypothetical protein